MQVRAVDGAVMHEFNFALDRWNMRMAVAHLRSLPPQVPDSWAVQALEPVQLQVHQQLGIRNAC